MRRRAAKQHGLSLTKLEPYGCEFVGFFCVRDKGSIVLNLALLARFKPLEGRLFFAQSCLSFIV